MRLAGIAAQCITPLFATRTATVASNWVETPLTGQLYTFYKHQADEVILWYLVHHSIHCIVLFGLPSAHIERQGLHTRTNGAIQTWLKSGYCCCYECLLQRN